MNPTITDVLADMGAAGQRLDAMHAVEAGAGNLSVALRDVDGLDELFPNAELGAPLPLAVPELAGYTVLVTGSGCRLRDVAQQPTRTVSAFITTTAPLPAPPANSTRTSRSMRTRLDAAALPFTL